MKHVTFIASGLLGGGIERAYTSLANHLVNNGFRVTAILLFKTEHFFSLDDKIEFVEPSIDRASMNKFLYALRIIPYLRTHIKRFSPDVLLSYGEWFNPFVIMSTRGLDIPLFVSDRMSPMLKLGFLQDLLKKVFYRYATGIIAQTSYAKEVISRRTGHKNIKVIPNPVNVVNIDNYNPQNKIITIGRLSPEKGHIYLIEAFSTLSKHTDWTLHIIGDGPERERLEDAVDNLEIRNRVIFHGHRKDIAAFLSTADIFVLPSLYEGFPNALIEAMSVPLACVSSNCIAGPSDIIDHSLNGMLFPPGDVAALRQLLDRLITNADLRDRLRKEAYQIREKLDFNRIAYMVTDFMWSGR